MFNRELIDELKAVMAQKDKEIERLSDRIQLLEAKLMALLDPDALKQVHAYQLGLKRDYNKTSRPPLIVGENGEVREATAEDRAKVIQGMQELGIM